MEKATKHKLVWGWLRLFLGLVQMFFAAAGVVAFVRVGLHPRTYIFLTVASVAAITSRILYRGKSEPRVEDN